MAYSPSRMVAKYGFVVCGGDPTGAADSTDAIIGADYDARLYGGYVQFLTGKYKTSASVVPTVPWRGPGVVNGGANFGAQLRPTMTDGSPAIDLTGKKRFHIENIGIRKTGADVTTPGNVSQVTAECQNAVGIRLGPGTPLTNGGNTSLAATRGVLRNVSVYGLAVAYDLYAWLCSLENLKADTCLLALQGDNLNNTRIDLVAENCKQGLVMTNSRGCHFTRYEEEGSVDSYLASAIDGGQAWLFDIYDGEMTRGAVPWLSVGAATEVSGLRILQATLDKPNAGTKLFTFDKLYGVDIHGQINSNVTADVFSATANTDGGVSPTLKSIYHGGSMIFDLKSALA